MLLFAYAGNMDVAKFSKTVPSAKKLGIAKLTGHAFVFNKTADDLSSKANITQSAVAGDEVWGVLIELNDNERDNFYDPDTWSSGLKLELVNCITITGDLQQAEAFFAQIHSTSDHVLPYDCYHKKIIQLADDAGLPVEYIHKLAAMPFKVDIDGERRAKRLKKLRE